MNVFQAIGCLAGLWMATLLAQEKPPTPGADQFGSKLPRVPVMTPPESREALVLRSGFRAELVAAEPLVVDPVALDFDAQGRLYVVQLPPYNDYVVRESRAVGSVVLLEDQDGDGTCDKSTVFAGQLQYPTAVACWDGGVFVADAPDLLYLKDTDGDGKSDQRTVIFTGFGTDKAGEGHLNSIRWGLDNRFHLSTNISGGEVTAVAAKDAQPVSVRGRGFMFDPRDLTRFELTSGGGQHGLSMDDWGRKFVCSNSVPAQTLMYDDRYVSRNPQLTATEPAVDIAPSGKHTKLFRITPPEPWRVLRTQLRKDGKFRGSDEGGTPFGFFTGATGITIYRGDAWPAEFHGDLFVGDVANNLVYRAELEQSGLGLVAHRADPNAEFLASTDIWFRPVQFANAPDGNLYVLDMSRELIEGAAFLPPEFLEHLDAASGNDRGRIHRIVADNTERRDAPKLDQATTAELVTLLEHANGWHRDTASRLLYQRQDMTAVPLLRELVKTSTQAIGRATALHAINGLGQSTEADVLSGLSDSSPQVRIQSLRLAESTAADSAAVRDRIVQLAADPDLLVRYQAAFSLGAVESPTATTALAQLIVKDGMNSWVRMAVLSSLHQKAGGVFQLLVSDVTFRTSANGRKLLTTLAQHIGGTGRNSDINLVLQSLGKLAESEKNLRESLVQALIEKQTGAARERILAAAGGQAAMILKQLINDAMTQATDKQAPLPDRVEAILSLRVAMFDDVQEVLQDLLQPAQPQPLQSAALTTAAGFDDTKVVTLILNSWNSLSPTLRTRASETLLSRPNWVMLLLEAVEDGKVKPSDIDPARVQLLKRHPDKAIAEAVARVFSTVQITARKEVVDRYQAALTMAGNSETGKAVFKKNCSACHRLEDVGTAVGAELKGIRQRGLPSVLLNILDPNREVKPQFLTYAAATRDGRVLSGMISAETANSVTLRHSDGTATTVPRVELEEMSSSGLSFMPEGLEKTIDVQAMADLLSYLNEID